MSGRAGIADWFWRLMHPRQARERVRADAAAAKASQEKQQQQAFEKYQQERAQRLSVAYNPESSPNELRRVLNEDKRSVVSNLYRQIHVHLSREGFPDDHESVVRYLYAVQCAVSAHPNIPPEVFGTDIPITGDTVAALLKNPVFPLLLLERPDFLERLDANKGNRAQQESNGFSFACFALRHKKLSAALVAVLTAYENQWIALEARTHVCYAREAIYPSKDRLI
jgi:hypothetical protein